MYAERQFMCGQGATGYAGIAGRLSLLGWDQVRVLVAPEAGWTSAAIAMQTSIGGEVGVGYRLVDAPGPFVQPGIEGSLAKLLFLRVDHALGVDTESRLFTHSGSMALGARLGPSLGQCYRTGRPLRRSAHLAPLPVAYLAGGPHQTSAGVDETEAIAARVWAARACAEWASVPAFWELAEQLAVCAAPEELRMRVIEAAEQEIGHGLCAARFAASLAKTELGLEPPVLVPREPAVGRAGLERLALESWSDGCVGEGVAAARAAAEAEAAEVPAIRSGQRVVAAEEGRHAELAWDILAWTLAVADSDTRSSILRSIDQAGIPHARVAESGHGMLAAYGCLSGRALERVADQHAVQASARLDTLLGDSPA
jgi:hypothetical protein